MTMFWINHLTMKRVNIHEAKAHLSRYLDEVERGETVIVCRRNVPIAELRAVARRAAEPRPIGLGAGRFEVPESFFADLPDEIVDGFSGAGG